MTDQELCDEIRRNMTEEQMKQALEDAGFAVWESGQELVEAVCDAVQTGDIPEHIIDNADEYHTSSPSM